MLNYDTIAFPERCLELYFDQLCKPPAFSQPVSWSNGGTPNASIGASWQRIIVGQLGMRI